MYTRLMELEMRLLDTLSNGQRFGSKFCREERRTNILDLSSPLLEPAVYCFLRQTTHVTCDGKRWQLLIYKLKP